MKRMIMSVIVEEKEVTDLTEKIRKLLGEVDIQISDAPPTGSGATLAGVA